MSAFLAVAVLLASILGWISAARTTGHFFPACTDRDINTINGTPACRAKAHGFNTYPQAYRGGR